MTPAQQKISKILRTDVVALEKVEEILNTATGKSGVLENILKENDEIVHGKLKELGLKASATASEIFDVLVSKVEQDDQAIVNYLYIDKENFQDSSEKIIAFVKKLFPPYEGYFLKKEKFIELLKKTPPQKILTSLGYKTVDELIAKENIYEIFAALRFLEGSDWLNNVFFKQYEALTFDDFEKRPVQLIVLSSKWREAAEKFVAKKYHNISHLKEFGAIFVIPIYLGISGEILRSLSLIMHYMYEVKFYAEIFERIGHLPDFADNLVYLLRGDSRVTSSHHFLVNVQKPRFLIIVRYLAKDDENDWRLFEPHVNPEAIHWQRAMSHLARINDFCPDFHNGLEFWQGLDWAGDFFRAQDRFDILISLNIIDTVMSLVKKQELIKYLYHQQEALWNKIFFEYLGEDRVHQLIQENIVRGYFEI